MMIYLNKVYLNKIKFCKVNDYFKFKNIKVNLLCKIVYLKRFDLW